MFSSIAAAGLCLELPALVKLAGTHFPVPAHEIARAMNNIINMCISSLASLKNLDVSPKQLHR
eukprot:scaffold671474_cov57-Prasinocladus_malaysianus.AAC.1